jgi:hypothetical protein
MIKISEVWHQGRPSGHLVTFPNGRIAAMSVESDEGDFYDEADVAEVDRAIEAGVLTVRVLGEVETS